MPKIVSTEEATRNLDTLIEGVAYSGEEVILEAAGTPQAVLISIAEYEQYQQLRNQARQQALLAELRQLREEVRADNQDLTDEQADVLAARFVREVVGEMIAEGKVTYESGPAA